MLDKVLKKIAQDENIDTSGHPVNQVEDAQVGDTVSPIPAMEATSEINTDDMVQTEINPENAWPTATTPEYVIPQEKQAGLKEFLKVAKAEMEQSRNLIPEVGLAGLGAGAGAVINAARPRGLFDTAVNFKNIEPLLARADEADEILKMLTGKSPGMGGARGRALKGLGKTLGKGALVGGGIASIPLLIKLLSQNSETKLEDK